jgi:SMC interacting uncharacterized protein involved in chromosome segregation
VEHAEKQTLLAALAVEQQELEEALAKQTFTPMEVQEMNHRQRMLADAVLSVDKQKDEVQRDIWDHEKKISQSLRALEKRAQQYNDAALALELVPATAKHAHGVSYELAVHPHAKTPGEMTSVDLTHTVKTGLVVLRKQLAADIVTQQSRLRDASDRLASAAEQRSEQGRLEQGLTARQATQDELFRTEKAAADEELSSTLAQIEAAERTLNGMRSQQARILEQSETNIHTLDGELVQQRAMQMAAQDKLLAEVHAMSEQVLEHKMHITQVLQSVLSGVTANCDRVELGEQSKTPRKGAMTPIGMRKTRSDY